MWLVIDTRLIKYWQKNLAESLLRDLSDTQVKSAYRISKEEFEQNKIKQADFLSSIRTERKKYLLCPYLFQKTDGHETDGVFPFLLIPVEITHDGRIFAAGERPFIPRKYLAPNEKGEVTISSIQQVQTYWRQNPFPEKISLAELFQVADEFRSKVIKKTVRFQRIHFVDRVFVIEDQSTEKTDATIRSLQFFYQGLFWKKDLGEKLQPLAKRMLTIGQAVDRSTLPDFHPHRLAHWGQINPAYGLTASQRTAVHHFLALEEGECLAVEGPPGTGKTTLLQSVIASLWVNEALAEKAQAPVILASSMTNLAIRNILDMFTGQRSLDKLSFADHPLLQRAEVLDQHWLQDMKRLGIYCVSQSQQNRFQAYQLIIRPNVKERNFLSSNCLDVAGLDRKKLSAMEAHFLQKCEQYFQQRMTGVKHAKVLLHRRLRQIVKQAQEPLAHLLEQQELKQTIEKMQQQYQVNSLDDGLAHVKVMLAIKQQKLSQLQDVREEWYREQEKPTIMHRLMDLPWIGSYFEQRRIAGNRYFIERRLPDETFPQTTDSAINERLAELEDRLKEETAQQQTEVKRLQRLIRRWTAVCKQETDKRATWEKLGFAQQIDQLESQLDCTYRVVAFWVATHYWEAQFLLTARERLEREQTSHQSVEEYFRELALISPCMVMTMNSAPRFLQDHAKHLYGFADLLIIDEASQALPEIAFPTLALAKTAIIVGDTKQLPPIPSIDQEQDQRNRKRFGLEKWIEQSDQLDISPSSGSVMKWANRLTRYVEKDGTPFLLREHFRCQKQVAKYFNQEFYQNQLVVKTRERSDFGLPALAYAHINGIEELAGGSRINHIEAVTIALWVKKFLQQHQLITDKQQVKATIAVLTPFKAQANVIRKYLKELNIDDLLIVGTVHSLQGMEKEVILFSPTHTSLENQEYFYDRDQYILNVAVSRAKQSFLIFGDMNCFGVRKQAASARLKALCENATEQLNLPDEEKVEQLLDRPRQQNGEPQVTIIAEHSILNWGNMGKVTFNNQ